MLDFLLLTISLTTPLALAAMGGYLSERSGVIHIGLEGKMLMAASATATFSVRFGPVGGVLCGLVAALLLSLLHWVATQRYRIDHIISGMAINALAAGGSNFLAQKFGDPNRSGGIPALPLPIYYVLAIGVPFALWLYAARTRGGLWLFAVGNDPDKARLVGLNPGRVRLFALLGTGVLCGIAGAMLVTDTGGFTDGMTAGRGYIALAALILGGWRPLPAALACVGFGFLSALRLQLQGSNIMGATLPSELWAALPYLATVIAMAGLLGRSSPPAGLGKD